MPLFGSRIGRLYVIPPTQLRSFKEYIIPKKLLWLKEGFFTDTKSYNSGVRENRENPR